MGLTLTGKITEIEFKGGVSPLVFAHPLPVDPDGGVPVAGPDNQKRPEVIPFLRNVNAATVPGNMGPVVHP